MVCIPCILAPVLLYIWYRFIQPIVLTFWNPWAPKAAVTDTDGTVKKGDGSTKEAKCPLSTGNEHKEKSNESTEAPVIKPKEEVLVSDKKND